MSDNERSTEALAVYVETLKENDIRHETAIRELQKEVATLKEDQAGLKAVIPQIFTMLSEIKGKIDKADEKAATSDKQNSGQWTKFFERAFWVVGTGIVSYVVYHLAGVR